MSERSDACTAANAAAMSAAKQVPFIHLRSHHVVSGASFLAYFSSHFLLYVTRQALETTTPTRHSARTERYSARMEASHPHPPISSRGGAQKPLHQHVSSYFTLRTR